MLKNISTDELSLELKTHESEFLSRKDLALKYELECKSLEAKLQECKTLEEDLDKKYNHSTQKLANINEIYNEKKEVFDNNHQNSLNETDKLENDLLKLKLESDSVYIKSERDFSESQIQLDVVKSFIARERNEINKILLEFENYVNNQFNTLKEISEEVKENLK
ncbi:hypothetical protein HERIO_2191 [Hepatospora eriocheir]|nr:hypothetical protein HERIO_2191 [Hepatospora eriocheir]